MPIEGGRKKMDEDIGELDQKTAVKKEEEGWWVNGRKRG